MKDYADFDAGDLAQDEFFVRWVKEPTPELEAKWVAWLAEHPDKAEEVEEARRMILAVLSEPERFPTEHQKEMMWNRGQHQIWLQERPSVWQNKFLRIEALLLICAQLSYFAYLYSQRNDAAGQGTIPKSTILE